MHADDWMPIAERISIAKNKILSDSLIWSENVTAEGYRMEDMFWNLFCTRNLMKEIRWHQPAYWLQVLNQELVNMLPRYNKIWDSYIVKFDPMIEYEKKHGNRSVFNENYSDTGNSGTHVTSGSKSVFNDTPSTRLGDADYATNITDDSGESETTTGTTTKSNRDHTDDQNGWEVGRNRGGAVLLDEYRNLLTDVCSDMCNELSDMLFFRVVSLEVY